MRNEDAPLGLGRNADFGRRAMLLNAQISGILAAEGETNLNFVVHTTLGMCTNED